MSESGCTARDVFAGANEFGPVLPVPGRNLASALHQTRFFLPADEFGRTLLVA